MLPTKSRDSVICKERGVLYVYFQTHMGAVVRMGNGTWLKSWIRQGPQPEGEKSRRSESCRRGNVLRMAPHVLWEPLAINHLGKEDFFLHSPGLPHLAVAE
jgi:hypothetical protein